MARMHRLRALIGGSVAVAATLTGVWAASASDGAPAPSPPTEAQNIAAARSDAPQLLARIRLPPRARRLPDPRAGGVGTTEIVSPDQIDVAALWHVAARPAAVMQFVRSHQPRGSVVESSGWGERNGRVTEETVTFAWPAVGGALLERWLVVTTRPLRFGGTALRAEAEVMWVKPRPPAEVIPSDAQSVEVSVLETLGRTPRVRQQLTVSSPGQIAALIALLNSLPVVQNGTRSCPADFGIRVRVAFLAAAGGPASSVAVADPQGCGGVALTIEGTQYPELESEPLAGEPGHLHFDLMAQLDQILGAHLKVG